MLFMLDKEVACINGEGTICVNGRWMIEERCPRRETCFALPLLESSGTVSIEILPDLPEAYNWSY